MALRTLRFAVIALLVLLVLATPSAIYSCGPYLESAIFAFRDRPDGPPEDFAAGKLGIVRPDFRQAYLVVAYRYFSGLSLTNDQQDAAIDIWNGKIVPEHPTDDESISAWIKTRNRVPNLPGIPALSIHAPVSTDQPYFQYVNCPVDALQTASRTLDDRITKFGLQSATVHEWVSAQDQVFSNCGGDAHIIPASLNSGDAQVRADRAYQIAAAHFYCRDFDQAVAEFDAIAGDHSSPWSTISSYLAARALIRKANLVNQQNPPFDPVAMSQAQKRLEAIVADPKPAAIHDASVRLLNYVRFRTEPDKRVAELDRMILQPDPGKKFKQELWDYAVLLSHGKQSEDPSEWVQTFREAAMFPSGDLRGLTAKHSISKWQQAKSLPWLIAALAVSDPRSQALSPLLAAANSVASSSAGYLTVRYYALRLMIAAGQADAARSELDVLLKRNESELPLGSHNLLNEQRLSLTASLEDLLQHAAETPVPSQVDFNTGEDVPAESPAKPAPPLFNRYAAEVFVKRLPLSVLIQAAESETLPKHLRREVARTAWVRSILIGDLKSADQLQTVMQQLDGPLWHAMEPFRSVASPVEKQFVGVFIILNNPGMKPSVHESSLRTTTLGELDEYRDNWWCTDMSVGTNWGQSYEPYNKDVNLKFVDSDPDFPFPHWLTASQIDAARQEWAKLSLVGTAPNYLVQQVIVYAKQHGEDPRVPQALHLAVRSTRFGCTNVETSKLSKAAFDFLHERYPDSEWTAKTKYYY